MPGTHVETGPSNIKALFRLFYDRPPRNLRLAYLNIYSEVELRWLN